MNRKLTVKKERLTELSSDELAGVAAGAPDSLGCLSLIQHCGSVHICSTVATCGCPLTETCYGSENCS